MLDYKSSTEETHRGIESVENTKEKEVIEQYDCTYCDDFTNVADCTYCMDAYYTELVYGV